MRLALRALDDLKQLDESLYERFVQNRKAPEDAATSTVQLRRLWDDTFRGLQDLLTCCQSLGAEQSGAPGFEPDPSASLDFGELGHDLEDAPTTVDQFELGHDDIGNLLEGLDDGSVQNDDKRWSEVLGKISSIEYGLRTQHADATRRLAVALAAGELNQVLGLLDDTQSSASEGVHAVVVAVYVAFAPDVDATTVVPSYLTSLGRALLVRRGLAELATKLAPYNETLQGDDKHEHIAALTTIRDLMRAFVKSAVCHAMRAADRWQMVEFERDLQKQRVAAARQTTEGLVKYLESLASINQREVLVQHDRRTVEEIREALAGARELIDLSPAAARQMLGQAYEAAQRLCGRHPATDAMLANLTRQGPDLSPVESATYLGKLEALLAAAGE